MSYPISLPLGPGTCTWGSVAIPTALAVLALSEGRNPPHFADDVSQSLGQAPPARLFHVKGSGQQVVEGAIAHGHHGAGEADDIIWHAEVRCWQVHKKRLCVETHKVA